MKFFIKQFPFRRAEYTLIESSQNTSGFVSENSIEIDFQTESISLSNHGQIVITFENKGERELHHLFCNLRVIDGFEILYSGMREGSSIKNFKVAILKPKSSSTYYFTVRKIGNNEVGKLQVELESMRAIYGKPEIRAPFDFEFKVAQK